MKACIWRILGALLDLASLEALSSGAEDILDDEAVALELLDAAGADLRKRVVNIADRLLQGDRTDGCASRLCRGS